MRVHIKIDQKKNQFKIEIKYSNTQLENIIKYIFHSAENSFSINQNCLMREISSNCAKKKKSIKKTQFHEKL